MVATPAWHNPQQMLNMPRPTALKADSVQRSCGGQPVSSPCGRSCGAASRLHRTLSEPGLSSCSSQSVKDPAPLGP